MGENSKIPWTHHTFNIAWGCVKESQGCKFCYAEVLAKRWGFDVWGPGKPRRLFGPKHWAKPLRWDKKAAALGEKHRVFCSSMTDVFLDDPMLEPERQKLWALVESTQNLTWLFLTKHPENVMRMLPTDGYWRTKWHQLPDNVWVGATIEDASTRKRLVDLLHIPAQVRFISYEPLLTAMPRPLAETYREIDGEPDELLLCKHCGAGVWESASRCSNCHGEYLLEFSPDEMIHWVIVGGESGHHARPLDPAWIRDLREDWEGLGVPFFFKQAGAVLARTWGCSDSAGENLTEVPAEFRVRNYPESVE